MSRGDKGKYTEKQKRKAEHIAESYEERGVSTDEAEAIAWATVNKQDGGGKKSGSGRAKASPKKAVRTPAQRSASAKQAAKTRARNKAALLAENS